MIGLRNISIHIVLFFALSLSATGQNNCITVFSAVDSSKIRGVEVFSIEEGIEKYTNKNGIVCFNKDSLNVFILTKDNFFTKNVQVTNKQRRVYLLPKEIKLNSFTVSDKYEAKDVSPSYLRKVEKMFLYHGKKSERINVNDQQANLATNNSRQLYRNIAGLNYFETSANGLGTEIGVRGLSPERSANLNVRQNGYDISADALGYPDAYYVPPAQSIDLIESVRGAGALQYGTQFGGMINYRKKKAPIDLNGIGAYTNQTIGSYNFLNSYNTIYGRNKRANFYSYFNYKKGDDWKPNSNFNAKNAFFQGEFQLTSNLILNIEYTHFYYLAQQPGGLTDALFKKDPTISIRERNWFSVNWNLASTSLFYKHSANTEIETKFFGLLANRKALGFLGNITRIDPLGNRDYLLDKYANIGNETKFLTRYKIKKKLNIGLIGIRFYKGNTDKTQGEANKLSGPDFKYNNPTYVEGSDYKFPSINLALFGENVTYLTNKLSVTLGARGEFIKTTANGYYRVTNTDLAGNILFDTAYNENKSNERSFVVSSLGLSYEITDSIQFYGNFSQNYRAINFNDLRITNANFKVDSNLTDEKGFNFDLGFRGIINNYLSFDISVFYLKYANRIGFVLKTDPNLFNLFRFRTNISQSRNIGLEATSTVNWTKLFFKEEKKLSIKQFFNTSIVDGRYIKSQEAAIENKKVELLPSLILKTGLLINFSNISASYQISHISEQYTDATNAEFASNAISGLIPAYTIMDASIGYTFKSFNLSLNINNLANTSYFTKRAVGYPGPGIIAAPPRLYYIGLSFKF